jgi:hypothetical protein
VIALDTNTPTKQVHRDRLSVLGVAVARRIELAYPELLRIRTERAIEFRNLKDPIEKHGWLIALEALYHDGLLNPRWKVGVIVDAYLDELSNFNAGAEIIPGHVLPANVKLIYASSDTAQFFAVNKCIKAADSIASTVAKAIFKNQNLHSITDSGRCEFYDAIRFWEMEFCDSKLIANVASPL